MSRLLGSNGADTVVILAILTRLKNTFLPSVHSIVNSRINHGISHSQPIETEIDMLDIRFGHNLLVVVSVDKIHVVGQPTNGKYQNHYHEHFHNLNSGYDMKFISYTGCFDIKWTK